VPHRCRRPQALQARGRNRRRALGRKVLYWDALEGTENNWSTAASSPSGGTDYYNDPSIPGTDYGIAELEGLRNARIYDPATNRWTQSGSMHYGRWYPWLVTLPDGKILVTSGVSKLLKRCHTWTAFSSAPEPRRQSPCEASCGVLPLAAAVDSANWLAPLPD